MCISTGWFIVLSAEQSLSDIPRVSILMTIYNAAPFLRESINSLLAQSFPYWELIVIENGSTDESPSILAEYTDSRIRPYLLDGNIGRTPALRYAFEQARGEYIAVLDADDISRPERLGKEVEYLDKHNDVVLVGTWTQYIDREGNVFDTWEPPTDGRAIHDCLGWTNPIVHSSAMYRKNVALAENGYPEEFVYAQDGALVLALAKNGRLAIIDEYLCQLRVLPERMTTSGKYCLIVAREGLILFQNAKNTLPLSEKARRLNRRAIAISQIKYGLAKMKENSVLSGLGTVIRGLACDPTAIWMNEKVRKIIGASKKSSYPDY